MAFALGWGWTGLFIYGVVRLFPGAEGSVTGILQTGGLLGAAAGPVVFGLTIEAMTFAVAWYGVAGGTLLTALIILAAAPSGEQRVGDSSGSRRGDSAGGDRPTGHNEETIHEPPS